MKTKTNDRLKVEFDGGSHTMMRYINATHLPSGFIMLVFGPYGQKEIYFDQNKLVSAFAVWVFECHFDKISF